MKTESLIRLLIGIVALGAGIAIGVFSMRRLDEHAMQSDHTPTSRPGDRKIAYYWDPMYNPPYISDKPGKSPMGMELIPVFEDEDRGSSRIRIDPTIVQNMGLRTVAIAEGPLNTKIRAVGFVKESEPLTYDVNLRVDGWIEKIHADTVGTHVKKDQPLFELYSPMLQIAIDELIAARKSGEEQLLAASKAKLIFWGLSESQVDQLAKLEHSPRTIPFVSPIEGDVTEKMIVAGAMAKSGERAMRIVDHSQLWLDVQIFEQDLPFVKLEQKVEAQVDAMPGQKFEGQIKFIPPQVDAMTRTATARVEIENPKFALKPGMYATVRIESQLIEKAILAPRESILDSGQRQIAFVASDDGHFDPRQLQLGATGSEGFVQVIEGLSPGEKVVVNGQFLLDAESRLREAIQKFKAGSTK